MDIRILVDGQIRVIKDQDIKVNTESQFIGSYKKVFFTVTEIMVHEDTLQKFCIVLAKTTFYLDGKTKDEVLEEVLRLIGQNKNINNHVVKNLNI